jgi:NAD(P)-dependent dehydrogenase (short-subunit alcohol dehydrogenase family)
MLEQPIRFSEEDIELFSAVSGDRNPLHVSREYASQTPYGHRVVFGALGAVACLGRMPLPGGWTIRRLRAEFLRPMFLNVDYRMRIVEQRGEWIGRLYDGSLPTLSLTVEAAVAATQSTAETPGAPWFERSEAAVREDAGIVPGLETSARYACDSAALCALRRRWCTTGDPFVVEALCCSSYLVGMDLPGRAALFSKLALDFERAPRQAAEPRYRASVRSLDPRTSQVRMNVSLELGDRLVAHGECWAFIRLAVPPVAEVELPAAASDALAGQVALVIGASRGLGAATRLALEVRGALVYALSRSTGDGASDRCELGDAADPTVLNRVRERISAEQGRLDILVCNACPPILPLRLELNAIERISDYVRRAISLTLAPLCTFLDLANMSGGCAVVISSAAVERPVREWPHYVAAKQAVEALARVAPLQYPRISTLIVRPEKMLTQMTNTPAGRRGALPPERLAGRIAERLGQPLKPGSSEILN